MHKCPACGTFCLCDEAAPRCSYWSRDSECVCHDTTDRLDENIEDDWSNQDDDDE
jgi:hypothetical protein